MSGCPFCAYALGEVELPEGGHQRDGVMAFPPLNPFAPGHVLFVPVAHVTDITTAPNPLVADVMTRASGYARQLLADLRSDYDGVNVLTSVGAAATQTVMHWHVHVVPRRYGDGLGGWPWRPVDLDRPAPPGKRWQPAWAVHPGEILQEEIDERDMTQAALADQLGCSYQHLNRVCRGHVRIEAPFAVRLEKALGISAELWLGLQTNWDLHRARAADPETTGADRG